MNVALRWWAIFVIAAKRLFSQKGLSLATLFGLVAAIALILSIPLYADAVYYRIFKDELFQAMQVEGGAVQHPPFAFLFRYIGDWNGPVDWQDVQSLDQYFQNRVGPVLGLPRQLFVRYLRTDNYKIFPKDKVVYGNTQAHLGWISLGFVDDLQAHITLTDGNFPQVADPVHDSTIEVLVSEALATEVGLQVGEAYTLYREYKVQDKKRSEELPVRISGVWKANDANEVYWFYKPYAFDEVFLIPQETFTGRLDPYLDKEVDVAIWYLVFDGANVHASDAKTLLVRIAQIRQRASTLLEDVGLVASPKDALQRYQTESALLTVSLYIFSIPVLVLTLTFLNLVISLAVGRKHNEIAVLRSRGATIMQVIGMAVVEGLILGSLALLLSLPVGIGIARIMGKTQSFLDFSARSDLRVAINEATWQIGLVALALALVAQVLPTIGAARHTIITYKQERARSLQPPWWQRIWLDVLLLIPAGYGAYLLRQQGSAVVAAKGELAANSVFQNPLLILVPSLGIFAVTLFFIRILPLLMSVLAWIASHLDGVGVLLATRQLARSSAMYTGPMVLLVLTLSLSTFIASLAQTLDNHLYDQFYYRIGADVSLADYGENNGQAGDVPGFGGQPAASTAAKPDDGPRWFFLPVSEYLNAPGVQSATRVGRFRALGKLSGNTQNGLFLGIDRIDFPLVTTNSWRDDFSPSYLGELMNALAIAPNGVLLPQDFMRRNTLKPGDVISLGVYVPGAEDRVEMQMQVMGGFDYFPTWYAETDGPLFVGNLDYLFEQAGGQAPYDVWLKTEPAVDTAQLEEDLKSLNFNVLGLNIALEKILAEQQTPSRQGLFGLLSVGFAAAAILTVLGFLLYALFSFRQRFIELGVLRAIGLSTGQMTIFLFWELAFLILTGLILGTGLGVTVSHLFIPYLQIGNDVASLTPPYLVEIAWPAIMRIYALFGLLFALALAGLTALLVRMRIFEAVKLGETV